MTDASVALFFVLVLDYQEPCSKQEEQAVICDTDKKLACINGACGNTFMIFYDISTKYSTRSIQRTSQYKV